MIVWAVCTMHEYNAPLLSVYVSAALKEYQKSEPSITLTGILYSHNDCNASHRQPMAINMKQVYQISVFIE